MILLTGSGGFIGRQLLAAFPQDAPIRLALRGKHASALRAENEVIVGNIDRNTDWSSALKGVSDVVHLAARVHVMQPTAEDRNRFFETNVLGTANLAAAAAAQGVRRFVMLSSIKVNGERTNGKSFTPEDTPHPQDDYGVSKLEAEERLFDAARDTQMKAIAVRSPLVYGSGVKANFLRLMSWVHCGMPLPLGLVNNRRSLISVWNLCDLIKRVLEAPSVKSGVLMVSDGEDLSTPDLIRRLGRAMEKPARLISVPAFLLSAAAKVTGRNAEFARLCGSLTVDIDETKRLLQWTPPTSVDEGLKRTVQWYLNETDAGSH